MIRCIAVDDEPLALKQIRAYIAKTPFLELAALCMSAADAQQVLQTEDIDLIFTDINMPDVNGMEFIRSLPEENRPLVVFTTAYPQFAVDGFRLDATGYLLKPFSYDEFLHAAEKARSMAELTRPGREPSSESDCISVRADHKVMLVRHADIVYVESDSEYVRFVLQDGTRIMSLCRLKNVEIMLPSEMFMRVHRSCIVNLRRISGYAKGCVYLDGVEQPLPVGDNYREAFMAYVSRVFPQQP
ncbi:MAG: response regulator transcription factor [Alistipes sp.]|nr:response regulator transcription factor [Alistipes sp.]